MNKLVALLGKKQAPRRIILTASLLILYLWTPYVNILPVPTFAHSPSAPSQNYGDTPLPPGTVTNLNSGGCRWTATQNEPLVQQSEWSKTLSIPKLLFMGTRAGSSNITGYYVVSDNGTFSTRDDAGNSFSVKPLSGLPSGITSVALRANSTTALQNFLVKASDKALANVTVVYSIKRQFCQPAGLKLTIEGNVDWGQSHSGRISLPFKHAPISVKTNRAWFGNQSGEALGFDWTDSLGLKPQFDKAAYTLSYPVNGTFSIDPATVATTTAAGAIDFGYQHQPCFAASRYWVFYDDGSNYGFKSSTDGNAWTSETTLTTAGAVAIELASFTCSGTTVYYAIPASASSASKTLYYRYGTLNSDGTISWTIPESAMSLANNNFPNGDSVAIDSSGDLWLAASTCFSPSNPPCGAGLTFYLEVWECTTPSSCSWSSVGWPTPSSPYGEFWPDVVSIGNAQVAVIYATPNIDSTTGKIAARAYQGGGSWTLLSQSGESCTSGGCGMYPNYGMGVATIGSTVEIATTAFASPSGQHPAYLTYTAAGGLSPVSNPDGTSNNDCTGGCSISSDGSSNLVLWMAGANSLDYMASSNSGSTWSTKATLETATLTGSRIAAGFGNGYALVEYVTGSSSPYDLRFANLLTSSAPPPAPTSTPAWGEPGLSPYESYINNAIVYVSMGNGLVSIERPTFSLPGRDLVVAPALLYSEPGTFLPGGIMPYQTDNFPYATIGPGWSLNIPWLGTYAVHLANGQQYPYNWNGNDMQVHGPVDFELTSSGAGGACSCVLTMPSGIQYSFNAAKQLVQESDATGNSVSYSYGSNGMLSSITNAIGGQVTFSYSGNQLTGMTAPGGRTWTLSYAPNQISMTDPVGRTTTFRYASTSSSGWLIGEVDYPTGGGRVTLSYGTGVVPGGISYVATSRNIYPSPGSLSQSDSISYVFSNGVLTSDTLTEADGNLNVQGHVTNAFSPSTGVEKTYLKDSTGMTFRVTENDFVGNRLTATKVEDPSGNVLAETDTRYDGWGNVVYARDNVGHETFFSYIAPGSYNTFVSPACSTSGFYSNPSLGSIHDRLVGMCDFQGGPGSAQQEAFFQYNAIGELTEQKVSHNGGWLYTDYTYDTYGNIMSTKDANGDYVYYGHSSAYQGAYLTKKSQLAGTQNITSYYAYDFNTGFITSKIDPNGQITSFAYDKVGRLLSTTYPMVSLSSSSPSVEQHSYDDAKGIVTTTDPNGNVAKEYFDGRGRETKLERWNGTSVYSTTYYTYNWMDKLASLQTPSGSVYSYAYDSVGRLLSQTNPDGTTRTASYNDLSDFVTTKDEDGHQTSYAYDWDGRLVSVMQYSTPQSYTTSYVHDGVGNLLSVNNNIGQTTSYAYDDLNRIAQVTTPDGFSTSYGYDNIGNLIAKTTPNGATIKYTYDQANRPVVTIYPDGSQTSNAYDPAGNILAVSSTLSGTTADAYVYDPMNRLSTSAVTVSGRTYTTSYAYDMASNLIKITYPDGIVVPMTYDAANRVKTIGNFATFAYNQDDTIAKITFGDGEVQTYAYDSRDRPTSIVDVSGSNKLLSLSYAYDGTGNIVSINGDKYTYDSMNRVTSAKVPGGTNTYAYDGAGNILSSTAGSTTTVYDNCGYYRNSLSGTAIRCGTDRDGNIVSKTGGGWTYAYNYEDEMTAVKLNGATVQTNVYDGVGSRVEKVDTDTTVFTYQGVNLLFEKDIATGATIDHIYGDGMQLAKVTGGTTYYYHEDLVGSNNLVTHTNPKGSITTQFSSGYGPYGSNYRPSGSEVFQYTDRMLDSATGLYYFNSRFYDPSIMRFMTKDPIAGIQSNPVTQNPYSYAGDNPLSNNDPTGLDWWNPLTWTPMQWFLFGSVAALTAISAVQFGLDVGTNALDAVAISELAGSFAAEAAAVGATAVGLPVITDITEDVGPDIFAALAAERLGSEAPRGMGSLETARAGESIVANLLTEAGIEFEYHPGPFKVTGPNGEPHKFTPDFAVGRDLLQEFNGFGIEVKTSSFTANKISWPQLQWYKETFGRNFAYVFVDINPNNVDPTFLNKIREFGGEIAWI